MCRLFLLGLATTHRSVPYFQIKTGGRHTGNGKEMLVRFVGTREPRLPTTNTKTGQLEISRSECASYFIRDVLFGAVPIALSTVRFSEGEGLRSLEPERTSV